MMVHSTSATMVALAGASWIVLASATAQTAAAQAPSPVTPAQTSGSTDAPAGAIAADSQPTTSAIGDIIVTAQRRSESIQNVPIAITAFSQQSLQNQRIEGGPDLVHGVPNVNFSKGYFSGYNFQIRGVGTQLGTAGGDAGVAVHINNVPLSVNRFFEADFFDVDRVEVLRGPQGTLYGRNATGGVVNVVTAKPSDKLEGMGLVEGGTYGSFRGQAMLNLPILDDRLDVRFAGSYLRRDGFGTNIYNGDNINNRNLWSTRASVRARPFEGLELNFSWQHFHEQDSRSRTGGSLCVKDNGPTSVGGVAVSDPLIRGYLSQGCASVSIYSPNSNQMPNSLATINGYIAQNYGGLTNGDYFANTTVSKNLQDTDSVRDPRYRATDDLFILNMAADLSPTLKATSITSYTNDHLLTDREFQGAVPNVTFASTALTPGGYYNDPFFGSLNTLGTDETITQDATQFTQEVRIDSSFHGPFNFAIGGIYVDFHNRLKDFTSTNLFTYAADYFNRNFYGQPNCAITSATCIYIEPAPSYQGQGHNYFLSDSPFRLNSRAVFGEAYYNITDRLKVTLGGRYTIDEKEQTILPVNLLVTGSGQTLGAIPIVQITNRAPTGRLAVDWKPRVSFTDSTLLYGVLSHGYKAGGLNPPASFTLKPPYAPEYVNSIEFGMKNTLLNGAATFNLTYFHYDYKNYQVTEIRDRTQQIQNINAKVSGVELESSISPVHDLRFNTSIGYLKSTITAGAFVDPSNFTNNDPALTLVRGPNASTCAVNTAALATYLATNPSASTFVNSVCPGKVPGLTPNLVGETTDLTGHELPNAPRWTVSAGAQYTVHFASDWNATLRGDYYWQAHSFARTYNRAADYLRSYDNVNMTFTIANDHNGWQAQAFVKNLFNTQPITNTFVTDQIVGLTRVAFVSDPRIVGLSLSKRFGN